jgi:hypothetical protein
VAAFGSNGNKALKTILQKRLWLLDMAFGPVCNSVLKLLIQIYIKPEF